VALAALSAAGAVAAAARYRSEMQRKRLALQGGGRTITTGGTTIEYAERGTGPAVLAIHGAGGGWDQGLLIARIIGGAYRWIAPARFGYLRSKLPSVPGAPAQARAYAVLLDHLGIASAAVVAMSAGAQSAIEFARQFPDRCRALVLLSAASGPVASRAVSLSRFQNLMLKSDPVMWAMVRLSKSYIASFIGATPKARTAATTEELALLDELIESLLPVSARAAGIMEDIRSLPAFGRGVLKEVRAPTLILHARDDRLVPVAVARAARPQIAGARLVEYPFGGHLLLGHHREVSREVRRFIDNRTTEGQEEQAGQVRPRAPARRRAAKPAARARRAAPRR